MSDAIIHDSVPVVNAALEEWRPIPDFPGYEASTVGRVRSSRQGPLKVLKPQARMKTGYVYLSLRRDGRYVSRDIHCLIAAAFLGPCPGGLEVNHKNGIKTDNRPENLEYLTKGDNHRHAYRTGLREPVGRKLTDAQEQEVLALKGKMTQEAIAEQFGVSRAVVMRIHGGAGDFNMNSVAPRRGMSHNQCRLTDDDVRAIRAAYPGKSQGELAAAYGVTKFHIRNIIHRYKRADVV